MTKQSLKEQFLDRFAESDGDGTKIINYTDADTIWEFFQPHLKKQSKPKIVLDIPLDKVKEFNELWPKEKLPTGKHGRCSQSELVTSFNWFFKIHPTFTDWNIILQAAEAYTREREAESWNYTRRSKYFIRKQLDDKSFVSDLSEYYERIVNGVSDESTNAQTYFEPRVFK